MENKFDLSEFVDIRTQRAVLCDLVNRIIYRRKQLKLSRRELSNRSGVSYSSIRRFEETGEISLTSLLKISVVLEGLNDFDKLFEKIFYGKLKDY